MNTLIAVNANTVESTLTQQHSDFSQSSDLYRCFALLYQYEQYYYAGSPELSLLACVSLKREGDSILFHVGVVESTDLIENAWCSGRSNYAAVKGFVEGLGSAWVNLNAPLTLKPVSIAKPWGQEIWYTGIESRGQSLVIGEGGGETPLPWLLSVAPVLLSGGQSRSLCLLKVLDPLPDEVYGDLYFEMHEEKREVYVVTHVDPEAWPDGCGGIRFGFNQELREELGDDAFVSGYFASVKSYEKVRREIDGYFDVEREQAGIGVNEPVAASVLKSWHGHLPKTLRERESAERRSMEAFTVIEPLRLGDVVKVPCFTPHSLQHGVRTIEFQTPVYERKILSFGQKVLTQSHWDTEEALGLMSLAKPEVEPLALVCKSDGIKVEEVVAFDDFKVFRVELSQGEVLDLNQFVQEKDYALIMPIYGSVSVADKDLPLSNAFLLGKGLLGGAKPNLHVAANQQDASLLLSVPVG